MEEVIVAPYPRVSYGEPLNEIATAPEISSVMAEITVKVPDEGTLPSEPIQKKTWNLFLDCTSHKVLLHH